MEHDLAQLEQRVEQMASTLERALHENRSLRVGMARLEAEKRRLQERLDQAAAGVAEALGKLPEA